MSDDPVREYGKFKTAHRNTVSRYSKRLTAIHAELKAALDKLESGLSAAAKRIREAAESVDIEANTESALPIPATVIPTVISGAVGCAESPLVVDLSGAQLSHIERRA